MTYRFLADGLGLRNHDIWPPRLDEAAPFGQAGAHRVDHEGSLIRECSEKCDWYLHFLRYNASWNGHSTSFIRVREYQSCPLYFCNQPSIMMIPQLGRQDREAHFGHTKLR